jgi:hypothetical protein
MAAALALARLTAVDLLRQPATWLAVGAAAALIGMSLLFGMFTFVPEDRMRMLCSAGLAVQAMLGIYVGVVGATVAVHRELAERTALTLLAKPLSRGSFLLGKALGVLAAVAACAAAIAVLHASAVWGGGAAGFEFDRSHIHGTVEPVAVPWGALAGGHLLAFAQAACLSCLAVVLALRLGLAGNIIACFAVWVVCHLLPHLGLHGALVLPALDLLAADDGAQVAGGLPAGAVLWGLLHAALWCGGALLLGLALFERQDID